MMKLRQRAIEVLMDMDILSTIPIKAIHTKDSKKNDSVNFDIKDERPRLVLIRGLPGSGKSSLAQEFVNTGYRHFEADRYFIANGKYLFDKTKIQEAHIWCHHLARRTLNFGQSVVVSNTFQRMNDLLPYLKLAQSVLIVETGGEWPNTHGITVDQIQKISKKWESL